MGAFSKNTLLIMNPGEWKKGEYVKIRTRQTVADQAAIRAAIFEKVPNLAALNDEELFRYSADAQVVLLQRMICEWKLFDDEDNEVPLNPENVAELDASYADYIMTQLAEKAPPSSGMSQEEQDRFLASASEPSRMNS